MQQITPKVNLNKLYPLNDNIGSIELIDYMGGDLAVVNDARVSYAKESKEFTEKDSKLIKYLIEHKHNSPLRSTVFKFRVKAPLSTTRQWYKHHIASSYKDSQDSWNEKSFRYVELLKFEYYVPRYFRTQSKTNKQQSEQIELPDHTKNILKSIYVESCKSSFSSYRWLVENGMAKEQARDVLPCCTYTEFIWTTSLEAVLNFLKLRLGEGSQYEIKQYAHAVEKLITPVVPIVLYYYNVESN